MPPHELKQMAPASSHDLEGRPSSKGTDDVYLTRLGKRPVLKVSTPTMC
jgi:hypothetical protein